MIHYVIIDDEPIAHRIIEGYCSNLPHLQKVANCYNAFDAMEILNKHSVNLVFLDINMPKLTGFEFLRTISVPPKVIVTTAYKEHALESYDLDVCDYLLKPFSFERFMKAVNKVSVPDPIKNDPVLEMEVLKPNRFFLKGEKKHYQVDAANILLIEAYGNYIKVYLQDNTIICHEKISSFQNLLSENFLRVHKSFIVALDKIDTIEGNRIFIGTYKVPVGQTYKNAVNKLLKS